MLRLSRNHVSQVYYVVHRAPPGRTIFQDVEDYVRYEQIVAQRLEQFDIHAHAFCWLPDAVYLAVQVSTPSLNRFMQEVKNQYVQSSIPSQHSREPQFQKQYQALEIHKEYLLELVRCVHRLACPDGAGVPPADFQWCSHRAYLQKAPIPWLTTHVALQTIAHLTDAVVEAYDAFMREEDAPTDPRLLASKPSHGPQLAGDALFMSRGS